MPDRETQDDLPRFVLDLDDISDVDDLELPDVKTPKQPRSAVGLALGSELRPRVIAQDVPNELDLALMADRLDIDPPTEPPTPPWPSAPGVASLEPPDEISDDSVDESPTPKFRPR